MLEVSRGPVDPKFFKFFYDVQLFSTIQNRVENFKTKTLFILSFSMLKISRGPVDHKFLNFLRYAIVEYDPKPCRKFQN